MTRKLTIWVTRTQPGAGQLSAALQDLGHRVRCAPVIGIEPLHPWRVLQWRAAQPPVALSERQLAELAPPALVITLSTHAAAAYLAGSLQQRCRDVPHIAIGPATRRALAAHPAAISEAVPATSEGVLSMPQVKGLAAAAEVWIMAGAGGRELLAERLVSSGIRVFKFETYRRRVLQVADINAEAVSVVVAGSVDGLRAAAEQWRAAGGDLTVNLVVPSARVADKARELGFKHVYNVGSAATEDFLSTITDLALEGQQGQ